ncbi:hypothetical protein DDE01_05660 [Desulfovibrio desulfuricans]|nr:hypothetical protein DDE01_05660 [Desulfovibrio desulfuricans]
MQGPFHDGDVTFKIADGIKTSRIPFEAQRRILNHEGLPRPAMERDIQLEGNGNPAQRKGTPPPQFAGIHKHAMPVHKTDIGGEQDLSFRK